MLAVELDYLSHIDQEFDITLTGFEMAEIDVLIDHYQNDPDPADDIPEVDPDIPAVTQHDDLWLIGKHRLLCADATDKASFSKLMGKERASMVFTDPPYNVRIDGHVCGSGKIKHREFQMASGEMSEAQFTAFLTSIFNHLVTYSCNGSIHFVCMDWRHIGELLKAGQKTFTELKNLCVWNKTNAGMGSLYRSKHELVFVFKSGNRPHINNIELGKHGRYRTNIWDYQGINTLHPSRRDELTLHPTVKPVAMVADAIQDCSKRNHIILDCFVGSGTTLLAAEKTGRRGYGMELDPQYVDTSLTRLQSIYGLTAIHAETGLDFSTLNSKRFNSKKIKRKKTTQAIKEVSHVER
jgi:DNA modification methylase